MYRAIQLKSSLPKPQALAIALHADTRRLSSETLSADKALNDALREAMQRPEFKQAKTGSLTTLFPAGSKQRLYVLHLGNRADHNTPEALRAAATKLVAQMAAAKISSLQFRLDSKLALPSNARALAEGMGLALCDFKKHKGARASKPASTGTLQVALPKALLKQAQHGLVAAQSANLARELAATPPNVANPEYLARYCRRLAKESSLSCTVIDHKRAAQLGMGGLVAVGQAGSTPSRLIILEHKPRGTASQAPVMLVGKAITFDTGGYSLKPVTGITSMKYDKCGGTAVIAAMHAIAQLKLPLHVVALIPAAENMIDSVAYRPDDILTMTNGVTVEIVSTDAEGRLVLADALAYGCKKFKPRAVIDLATLTGGVVVALGKLRAGAFCNDDKLLHRLQKAGEETGERLWPLPMPAEYQRLLHSEHADMKNSAGREAHAIQGAVFLSNFVARNGDFKENAHVPWAHLDIAGVADVEGPQDHYGLFPKGPTGFGVRLLVNALEDFTP